MKEKINTNTALLIMNAVVLLVWIWIGIRIVDIHQPIDPPRPDPPKIRYTSVDDMFDQAYAYTVTLQNQIEAELLTDYQIERLRDRREETMRGFVGSMAYFRGEVVNVEADGSKMKIAIDADRDVRHPYSFVVYVHDIPADDLEDLYIGCAVAGWGKVTKFKYANCFFPGHCFWADLDLQKWADDTKELLE